MSLVQIPGTTLYRDTASMALVNRDSSGLQEYQNKRHFLATQKQEINNMRDVYIIILKKIPAMPPLAQLSFGIQRALNDAEHNRDIGDYRSCE